MEQITSQRDWARNILGAEWFDGSGFAGHEVDKVDKKKASQIYDRLIRHENKKVEDLHRRQLQKLYQERVDCTFQPELVAVGSKKQHQRISNSRSMNPISLRNSKELHERVDEIIRERTIKVAMMKADEAVAREEQFKGECTFKPKINPTDKWAQGFKPKVADIGTWKQKLQDKLFEEYFETRSNEKLTFRPTISKHSEKLLRAKTPEGSKQRVEDRLFNLSKSRSNKKLHQSPVNNKKMGDRFHSTSQFAAQAEDKPQKTPQKVGMGHRVISVAELCADIEKHKSASRSLSAVSKKQQGRSPKKFSVSNMLKSSNRSSHHKLSQPSFNHLYDSGDKENQQPATRLKKRKHQEAHREQKPNGPYTNSFTLVEEQAVVLSDITNHEQTHYREAEYDKRSHASRDRSDVSPQERKQGKRTTKSPQTSSTQTLAPEYTADSVSQMLGSMLANPRRTKMNELLPKDRTKVKADGRQYVKFGEQKIYYREEDLQDIINFSLRAKTFC